jgi:hypothetical protein
MKPICFVLGAGASAPYDFPIGSELVTEILGYDEREFPWDELGNRHELKNLQDSLRYSDHSSIDILLLHRRDLWKIGTQAIAVALLTKEHPSKLGRYASKFGPGDRGHDRWYGQCFELLSKCVGSFAEFTKLPISFVTFNYDRSFDFFFWQWLQAKYEPNDRKGLDEYLSTPRIFHVHGQLGLLAFQSGPGDKLEYGRRLTTEIVTKAAVGIRIPHDDQLPGYAPAVEHIKSAHTIVFLGFGFDEANLERLSVPNIDDSHRLEIFGTTYGLSEPERTRVLRVSFGNGHHHDFASDRLKVRDFFDAFWPKLKARLMQ